MYAGEFLLSLDNARRPGVISKRLTINWPRNSILTWTRYWGLQISRCKWLLCQERVFCALSVSEDFVSFCTFLSCSEGFGYLWMVKSVLIFWAFGELWTIGPSQEGVVRKFLTVFSSELFSRWGRQVFAQCFPSPSFSFLLPFSTPSSFLPSFSILVFLDLLIPSDSVGSIRGLYTYKRSLFLPVGHREARKVRQFLGIQGGFETRTTNTSTETNIAA